MKISDTTRQALAKEWLLDALIGNVEPTAVINYLKVKAGYNTPITKTDFTQTARKKK
jgi:hypothetical protein